MLGKMIKHELKETGKILIPLNLIVLGIMLLNAVFLGLDLFQKGYLKMIPTFSLMLYVLGLFALFVLTAVYLTMRFYKTMYSNQGYLTHTLPLSTTAILNTKILTAVLWLVIAFAATIGSILFMVKIAMGSSWDPNTFPLLKESISRDLGIGFGTFLSILIVMIICFIFSMTLMVFASLSVGQLFHQNKIPASIGAYIIFYMIQQIISVIFLVILAVANASTIGELQTGTLNLPMDSFFQTIFAFLIVQCVALSIAYYIISLYISNRKLNLE